jgi:hypothetical protein
MRSKNKEMVVASIPRSLLLCSFSLMKKNEKIKTQKSFHAQTRTLARFCVGHRAYPINI